LNFLQRHGRLLVQFVRDTIENRGIAGVEVGFDALAM